MLPDICTLDYKHFGMTHFEYRTVKNIGDKKLWTTGSLVKKVRQIVLSLLHNLNLHVIIEEFRKLNHNKGYW